MGRRLITIGYMSAMTLSDPGLTAYFGLTMEPALLWWSTMTGATGYDVVRGDAATLQSTGGDFAQATTACVADNQVETSMPYTAAPAVGEVWWFAARKVTGGGNGTYDGGDATQVGSRDAGIAASGHGCP
jgi:hypothetical protein